MAAEGTIIVAACALALNAMVLIGGTVWALGKTRRETEQMITSQCADLHDRITRNDQEARDRVKIAESAFGDTGSALRRHIEGVDNKIGEAREWARDEFVRKEDFKEEVRELKEAVNEVKTSVRDTRKEIREDIAALAASLKKE